MATKGRCLAWLRRDYHWLFLLVAGVFLLLHIFIFRSLLPYTVDFANNNASVVREELIPYFEFDSQYLPDGASELTGSNEFRVVYAFWTSWVRQNAILPYALILLNTLSVYILFYAIYRIVRKFLSQQQIPLAVYASALSALAIHLILLYSKVVHFYSLIFGFSLFALSISLVLEQVFFKKTISYKNVAAVSLLTLINPAIHYHLIFYLVLILALGVRLIIMWITKTRPLWQPFKQNLLYALIVIVLSLVPYLIFVHFALPSTDEVFSQTPVNYWMVYFSSVPLNFLFSLDTYGHVDLYRYGDYLAPTPRYFMITIYAVIAAATLLLAKKRALDTKRRYLLFALFIILIFSLWMSLGYRNEQIYSFHRLLSDLNSFIIWQSSFFADALSNVLGLFINILRYPHRFEFIMYYVAAMLFALGLCAIFSYLQSRRFKPAVCYSVLALLVFVPILCTTDYRVTFLSGDFGGFLKPYRAPTDLVNIKNILAKQDDDKLFIMPSLESGRQISQNGAAYTFLDKYLIYYLNQPSIYYGTNANVSNKISSFMVYRAIAYDQSWWQDILVNNLGVTNILVPKNLEERPNMVAYLPGIEEKIASNLAASGEFSLTYQGDDYDLYTANVTVSQNAPAVFADYTWGAFLEHFGSQSAGDVHLFFPTQVQSFLQSTDEKQVVTDNPERAFYTLAAASNSDATFYPNSSALPFTSSLVASSNFTANTFSLSTLYNKDSRYNYTQEVVPSLLTLSSTQFVGLTKLSTDKTEIKITAPEEGDYRIALHSASNQHTIAAQLDGIQKDLTAIDAQSVDYIDFTYYTVDVHLSKGAHRLELSDLQETVLVENLTLLPSANIPEDFNHATVAGFSFDKMTNDSGVFTLTKK